MEDDAKFELKDGREVCLMGFATRDTYHSALEGSEEGLSRLYRRQGLAKCVADVGAFAGGYRCAGIQVMDPGTPALPPVLCVAYLKLFGQGQAKDVFHSHLLVGWFAKSLFISREMTANVLKQVEWDAHAESILLSDT